MINPNVHYHNYEKSGANHITDPNFNKNFQKFSESMRKFSSNEI